jgi:hypothetical protein
MNWEAIAAFGETIGALAVLVTLMFLWRQMAQTNRGQHVMAFTMWNQMRMEVSNAWAQADFSAVIARGLNDPAALSADDARLVFHNRYHMLVTFLEMTYSLWRKGLLDEASWNSGRHMLAEVKGASVFELWWSSVKRYYDPEFCALLDTIEPLQSGYALFAAKLDALKSEDAA